MQAATIFLILVNPDRLHRELVDNLENEWMLWGCTVRKAIVVQS